MEEIKHGTLKVALYHRKRRKRILKLAKGYYGAQTHLVPGTAKEQVMNSYYSRYTATVVRKRDFRKLITRINAAARLNGTFILTIDV